MDNKLKQTIEQLKVFMNKYNKKTKIIALITFLAIVVGAIGIATLLNHKNYAVLYSELSQSETQTILSKLQELGVAYQYKENGTILVEEKSVDLTRAQLAQEGYPKSGFSYDTFINNTGGMTTDSAEQTYKLYELQNRIGATIELFAGVKEAKVTIAPGKEQKYALQSEEESNKAKASVTVIMKEGEVLSQKQATGIQRLVATSVPNLEMENVSVLDGNGLAILTESDSDKEGSGSTAEELAQIVENQIQRNIINVLSPIYGEGNVRVSAKGKFNMEKVIREMTTYNTPDKINKKDKTGIISKEEESLSVSDEKDGAGGVAGTESNADIPEYTTSTSTNGETYRTESAAREYLVNQIKEQGQIDVGVLEDLRVAVTINGRDYGELTEQQLISLIGNASGIANRDWKNKITVVSAPFYGTETEGGSEGGTADGTGENANGAKGLRLPWWAFAIIGGVIILLLIVILILRRRKKKRIAIEEELERANNEELENAMKAIEAEKLAMEHQMELFNYQSAKSQELRDNVREFAETNPEISAQMIKNWLNGGEDNG